MNRILAVDTGDMRLGIAISDPTGTIARPLEILLHSSRQRDAEKIVELAQQHDVSNIVIGIPYDDDGEIGPQARKALRMVDMLRKICTIPIQTWDESGSTQAARRGRLDDPDLDARAAAVILQDYLNAQSA